MQIKNKNIKKKKPYINNNLITKTKMIFNNKITIKK